jgi:hypothetical protein
MSGPNMLTSNTKASLIPVNIIISCSSALRDYVIIHGLLLTSCFSMFQMPGKSCRSCHGCRGAFLCRDSLYTSYNGHSDIL